MVLKSLFVSVNSGHKYPGILTIVLIVSITGLLLSFLLVPDSRTETGFVKHVPASNITVNSSALLPKGQSFQDGLEGGITAGEMKIDNPDKINLGSSTSSPYGVGPKSMFTNPAIIVITE